MDDYRRPEASEHFERGIALERAGRVDEALAEYRRAVDVDPGFAEAYEALGYHYQRRGLLRMALDAFQTVARLEGDYTAHFNAGYILVELERYGEALESFRQCLSLAPNDPAALYETGYVNYVLGQLPEALSLLELYLQVHGQDWRVCNLLGAVQLDLGQWPQAETNYQRALELAASTDEVEEARSGLQVAQRYQEFLPDDSLGFKDRAYADAGVVVLGTAGDDGMHVGLREDLLILPETLAVTLRRLQLLVQSLVPDLTAVVAVDRSSLALAMGLGELFAVPWKRLSQLSATDRALLVLMDGQQPEFLQVALEQSPPGVLSFVYAMRWYRENELLPEFIGVPVKGRVEWGWEVPRDESQVQLVGRSLAAACQKLAPEPTQEAQLCYYLQDHRRLRFRE